MGRHASLLSSILVISADTLQRLFSMQMTLIVRDYRYQYFFDAGYRSRNLQLKVWSFGTILGDMDKLITFNMAGFQNVLDVLGRRGHSKLDMSMNFEQY